MGTRLVHFAADRIRRAREAHPGRCWFRGKYPQLCRSRLFDLPAAAKPLLHLWSLGVEEQFYIVFPALLLLLWRYKTMSTCLALIGLASFALNIALVRSHPSFTFYLPLTRFWEFIAGALLAWAHLYGRSFA